MDENRIYHDKVDINNENTRSFYDKRAEKLLGEGKKGTYACPYTSVLLGDQNPEHAAKWNAFERSYIFPRLDIASDSDVLDIGCGMGRWAEHVAPLCRTYCGVDFSSEMIHAAEKKNYGGRGNCTFLNDSLLGFLENKAEEYEGGFNRLIMAGVCMYINDDELCRCLEKLPDLLGSNSVCYMTETVGIGQRLTLREFYSEALGCNYDAIYRTPEEYIKMSDILKQKGYRVSEMGFLPKLNKEEAFHETDRWYCILHN